MKCLCPFSGRQWKAEGFSTGNHALIYPHPVFNLPFKYLISRYTTDWHAGRLDSEEKTLLFLAALKETDLAIFDTAAFPEIITVEQNIESLMKLSSWLHSLRNPAVVLPSFRITKETNSLANMAIWLQTWWNVKQAFEDGYRQQARLAEKSRLEYFLESKIARIEAGIANETPRYLRILASWASIAARFPNFAIAHPISGESVKLVDYWQELIAAPASAWYNYPLMDWAELRDHVIDNVDDLSSSFALALIRKLNAVINKTGVDLGLEIVEKELTKKDEADGKVRSYFVKHVLEEKESQFIDEVASRAPKEEPKESQYAKKSDFLRAKIAWRFAQQQQKKQASQSNKDVSSDDL